MIHWAEYLRARGMKKEQASFIQPVDFPMCPLLRTVPLELWGKRWRVRAREKPEEWPLLSFRGHHIRVWVSFPFLSRFGSGILSAGNTLMHL